MQVIDVRSPAEYASGHVPGATNIPMEQLEARIEDVAPQLVLVCQAGTRATMSAGWIREQRKAMVLEGGTDAWQRAGYPLVYCTPCRWSLERQVRLGAGLLVLTGTLLSLLAAEAWLYLAVFVGAGLTFAGLTNICGMGLVLAHMPWNRNTKSGRVLPGPVSNCCS